MTIKTWQSPEPRIAIYSQDGFGLGHMRRTSNIARQVSLMSPEASILTLSDSPLGQFFSTTSNHDYIKLPSIVKSAPGQWQATHLALPFDEVKAMREQLIRSALLSFAPDILLVDHMPHGAMGELIPALEALREQDYPTQVVLGLRDILDAPEVIAARWADEGAFETLDRYYSRILIYGMRDVYNTAEIYHFPVSIAALVRYCGYVCDLTPQTGSGVVRARYLAGTTAGTQLVVAMAGGGADAYPMMKALLDAAPIILKERRSVFVLITGPFMPPDLIQDLQRQASSLPVHLLESVEDTLSYVSAADLVVSMAGYNSCTEILRMKKPAILIPRAGPSAEQRTRARLFAARQWVDLLDSSELSPAELAQKALHNLHCPQGGRNPSTRPELIGGIVAANQVLSLLPQKEKQVINIYP